MKTDMSQQYAEALKLFFEEAQELLEQFESSLLALEHSPDNIEDLHAIFRSAHTIKGSAGVFGLTRIVDFTHHVESLLDRLRNRDIRLDAPLFELLFRCRDAIVALVEEEKPGENSKATRSATDVLTSELLINLHALTDAAPSLNQAQVSDSTIAIHDPAAGVWHLSLRFGKDTFRNGFDPLSVLRYLDSMGSIESIMVIDDSFPEWNELDPETCHLGFEVKIQTTANQRELDDAFEFVRDDCVVRMLAPDRRASDILHLLNDLPNETRLGEILVACGAISRTSLEAALAEQREEHRELAGAIKPLGELLVEKKAVSPEIVDAALAKQNRVRESNLEENRLLKVPAAKLDHLINLVGELVVCGSSAGVIAQGMGNTHMIETVSQVNALIEEIRNGTLSLRMVQIGDTLTRFRRLVRDVGSQLGKSIQLEIEGGETELDKTIVEKIVDPLTHLVRNALDHGIEKSDERVHAGKPATATLRLAARHETGAICISVADDGRGIDGEKVVRKAIERGLIGAGDTLTEAEKQNLIFLPGFSTAETITDLSGRGVGMDVVKRNIESLRGSVHLRSAVGTGTTVEIRLPLTLAIIDGFLVKVASNYFVIPLDQVVECIDAPPPSARTSGRATHHVDLRGALLPYLNLGQLFDLGPAEAAKQSIVVIQDDTTKVGLLVHHLVGEHQTVIKPLGKLFSHLRGISGSTVLGTGEVALILDVPALIKLAGRGAQRSRYAAPSDRVRARPTASTMKVQEP